MIQINENNCPQNHRCPLILRCPVNAISQQSPFSVPGIDFDKCTECGLCTKFCGTFQMK